MDIHLFNPNENSKIGIIIPTLNEEKSIGLVLTDIEKEGKFTFTIQEKVFKTLILLDDRLQTLKNRFSTI